jgi:hypothetical protein
MAARQVAPYCQVACNPPEQTLNLLGWIDGRIVVTFQSPTPRASNPVVRTRKVIAPLAGLRRYTAELDSHLPGVEVVAA